MTTPSTPPRATSSPVVVGFEMLSPSSKKIRKHTDGRWYRTATGSPMHRTQQCARNLLELAKSPPRARTALVRSPPRKRPVMLRLHDDQIKQMVTTGVVHRPPMFTASPAKPSSPTTTPDVECPALPVESAPTIAEQPQAHKQQRKSRKRGKMQKLRDGVEAMWAPNAELVHSAAANAFMQSLDCGLRMHQETYREFSRVCQEFSDKDPLTAFPKFVEAFTSWQSSIPGSGAVLRLALLMSMFLSDADAMQLGCYQVQQSYSKAWDVLVKIERFYTGSRQKATSRPILREMKAAAEQYANDPVAFRDKLNTILWEPTLRQFVDELFLDSKTLDPPDCPPYAYDPFETVTSADLRRFEEKYNKKSAAKSNAEKSKPGNETLKPENKSETAEKDAVKPDKDKSNDLIEWEEVRLEHKPRVYASVKTQCGCDCHQDQDINKWQPSSQPSAPTDNVPSSSSSSNQLTISTQHCNGCRLKFNHGQLYVLMSNNRWLPADVSRRRLGTARSQTDRKDEVTGKNVLPPHGMVLDTNTSGSMQQSYETVMDGDVSNLPGLVTASLLCASDTAIKHNERFKALLSELDDECSKHEYVDVEGVSADYEHQQTRSFPQNMTMTTCRDSPVWSKSDDEVLLTALEQYSDDLNPLADAAHFHLPKRTRPQILERLRFLLNELVSDVDATRDNAITDENLL